MRADGENVTGYKLSWIESLHQSKIEGKSSIWTKKIQSHGELKEKMEQDISETETEGKAYKKDLE